jgi:hypothetical protein
MPLMVLRPAAHRLPFRALYAGPSRSLATKVRRALASRHVARRGSAAVPRSVSNRRHLCPSFIGHRRTPGLLAFACSGPSQQCGIYASSSPLPHRVTSCLRITSALLFLHPSRHLWPLGSAAVPRSVSKRSFHLHRAPGLSSASYPNSRNSSPLRTRAGPPESAFSLAPRCSGLATLAAELVSLGGSATISLVVVCAK